MELSMEQKEYYMGVAKELDVISGLIFWLESMNDQVDKFSADRQELYYRLHDKTAGRLKELKTELREKRVEFGEIPEDFDDDCA
ncbi:MAG: hypothetical protein IJ723_01975 [Ruminococcus sp.]|nr:hypothetical protein [Ruminococcus sp.]